MKCDDYTVGWICATPTEATAACELLDDEHQDGEAPQLDTESDDNSYTFGRMSSHNIVIAYLPSGRYGYIEASHVASKMWSSFRKIRFGLMVGIAGGAPTENNDIRLGDVVVSMLTPGRSGVINYNYGKAIQDQEFEVKGSLSPPPAILLKATASLQTLHKRKGHKINETVTKALSANSRIRKEFGRPPTSQDRLFSPSYVHGPWCECLIKEDDTRKLLHTVARAERTQYDDDPAIHYGLVALSDQLIKDAKLRDKLAQRYNVKCFEMEAAGLMGNFPCLVIRGICDYSDTHKNDIWQGYASLVAAAYAKELLGVIPSKEMFTTASAMGLISSPHQDLELIAESKPIDTKLLPSPALSASESPPDSTKYQKFSPTSIDTQTHSSPAISASQPLFGSTKSQSTSPRSIDTPPRSAPVPLESRKILSPKKSRSTVPRFGGDDQESTTKSLLSASSKLLEPISSDSRSTKIPIHPEYKDSGQSFISTADVPYVVTSEKERWGSISTLTPSNFHSITHMPYYQAWSFEELRLNDYARGLRMFSGQINTVIPRSLMGRGYSQKFD